MIAIRASLRSIIHSKNDARLSSMLGFISKNVLRSRALIPSNSTSTWRSNVLSFFSTDATGEADVMVEEPVKSEFNVEQPVKDSSFTVSYLVKSCGLTPEAAQNACKLIHLKSAKRSDRVLSLLRDNGFSDANIAHVVARRPALVVADPKTTLKPKFELFSSLGAPKDAIVKMLVEYPEILHKSLDKSLLPSVEFLRSFLHTDEKVFQLINKCRGILRFNLPYALGPNVKLLRDEGVGDHLIAEFLSNSPQVMMTPAVRFAKMVDKVRIIWIGPKRYGFLDGISVISSISDREWERKAELFKKWGWSAAVLNAAFSKQPKCMVLSEKKIEKIMKYLVKTMELDPLFPANNPNVFLLSLKNQIIPRCSIIRYLLKMGVISKEDFEISDVLESKEEAFLRGFVKKYSTVLPELLDLYTFCKKCAVTGRSQPV